MLPGVSNLIPKGNIKNFASHRRKWSFLSAQPWILMKINFLIMATVFTWQLIYMQSGHPVMTCQDYNGRTLQHTEIRCFLQKTFVLDLEWTDPFKVDKPTFANSALSSVNIDYFMRKGGFTELSYYTHLLPMSAIIVSTFGNCFHFSNN